MTKDLTLEFSPTTEPAMVAAQVPGARDIAKPQPPAPTQEVAAVPPGQSQVTTAPAQAGPSSLLPAIISLAKDSSVDVAKLDALLKMQAQMEDRQAKQEFTEAYTRMSEKLPRVKKNGTIDLGKGREIAFARWEDMDKVVRPIYTAEGFTLSFDTRSREGGGLVVVGELLHRSGHSKTAEIPLPLDVGPGRNNLQAVGSTLSYGKRYCAEMLLNIVREGDDDDGNKGGMAFITAEEADELRLLMEETKTEEPRFCAIFNIAHLGEMQEANLTAAKNLLLTKKKKPAGVS
jgi:hypothetical protein